MRTFSENDESGSRKVFDQNLNRALISASKRIRAADELGRAVTLAVRGIGLAAALLLPLSAMLQSPAEPAVGPTAGDVVNFTNNIDKREVSVPDTAPYAPTIQILNNVVATEEPSEQFVMLSPPGKLWHRSAFRRAGDQLWALPDASFKLTLRTQTPCGAEECAATFEVQGVDSSPNGRIEVNGSAISVADVSSCKESLDDEVRHEYVYCDIKRTGPAANSTASYCLWVRRAVEDEIPGAELVALDIRWEEGVSDCR